MHIEESINKLLQNPNIWRTFSVGRKYYQRREAEQIENRLLDFAIKSVEQILMLYLGITIEDAEYLLSVDLDDNEKIVITPDLEKSFEQLYNLFPDSKTMAKACGVSQSTVSLYKTGRRKLTLDKMIRFCQSCKKPYTIKNV